MSHFFSLRPLVVSIAAACVSATALAGPVVDGWGPKLPRASERPLAADGTARYVVRFTEPPVALFDPTSGMNASGLREIPSVKSISGRRKLDMHSAEARAYQAHLDTLQTQRLNDMSKVVGRSVSAIYRMQHAANAAVVALTPVEASKLAGAAGVRSIRQESYRALSTDRGPRAIGATVVWQTPAGVSDALFIAGFDGNVTQGRSGPQLGDGLVIGDIDTGYNSASPSFAATDDTGYAITNPLGDGNYLGQCSAPGVSIAGCNNKVIGVYDSVGLVFGSSQFSVEDVIGHGSHTASTIAGNSRSATLQGYTAHISGVAPHANLVIYKACDNFGCPDTATSAAVDQAVRDGVVDALNFSISGGIDAWDDLTSEAFLAATHAGIFIAAAAGNTSESVPLPVPGSTNHWEPWVMTVAAATHNAGPVASLLTIHGVDAPAPIGVQAALFGTEQTAPIPPTSVIASPTYGHVNDACNRFTSGYFAASIAVLRFGGNPPCGTNTRSANAVNAGASFVVFGSQDSQHFVSGANQPVPVYTTTGIQADRIAAYMASHPTATASISYPPNTRVGVDADSLANFSLRGPVTIDLIKPDVQAPGVSILAAIANNGGPGGAARVGLLDGTSMATPHTTGAGGLLLAVHLDWTPMQVKSALMMTAREAGLTQADGRSPSDFFDRGSGAIQVDLASKAGLILDESLTNFQSANPALGGDGASALNLASMQSTNCVTANGTASTATCTFIRKFRGTRTGTVQWTAALSGVAGSVTPTAFSVTGIASRTLHVQIDASAYASDGRFHQGEVVLTPDDPTLPRLHLPVAVALQPPAIEVPSQIAIAIPSQASSGQTVLPVTNNGGPMLSVMNTNLAGTLPGFDREVVTQPLVADYFYSYESMYYTDRQYASIPADDIVVTDPVTNLASLSFAGRTQGQSFEELQGTPVHFRIFPDVNGDPAGDPIRDAANAQSVWHYDTTLGAAGVRGTNGTLALDLVAAGAPDTALPPGRYWIMAYVDLSGSSGNAWLRFSASSGNDSFARTITTPMQTNWSPVTDYPGLAMVVTQRIQCGAPWLSTTPASVTVGGEATAPVTVLADATLFGNNQTTAAYLCLQSNDNAHPIRVVRVAASRN